MRADVTPERVRELLDGFSEPWSVKHDPDADEWRVFVDDEDCEYDVATVPVAYDDEECVARLAALIASAPEVAAAYLALSEENARLRQDLSNAEARVAFRECQVEIYRDAADRFAKRAEEARLELAKERAK